MKTRTKDAVSKAYFSDPERFAQIFNNELFGGIPMVKPEYLTDLNTSEMKTFGMEQREVEAVWKNRDILKSYGNELFLAILEIENQSNVHYAMPLRNMLYDALNYEQQRAVLQKEHRKSGDLYGSRYISGLSENDRLIPVFTLVIYYGEKPWDGPKNLQDLLDIPPELEEYRDKLADYKINLLDIHSMDPEIYSGELKAMLGFIKYQGNKALLNRFIGENSSIYEQLTPETVQAISVLGKIPNLETFITTNTERGEESMNICKAIDEMMEDKRQEGIEEGRMEGRTEGIRILIQSAAELGIQTEKLLTILQRDFSLTEEKACEYLKEFSTQIN